MKNLNLLAQSINKLETYIQQEKYRGYDPYDALTSPFLKFHFLKKNKLIRFGLQQFVKRSPINLRTFLSIKKGYNPVSLGLCIQAYTYLSKVYPQIKEHYKKEIDFLIDELTKLQSKNYSGLCWGYDFDWEARYCNIPAYIPTIVATGFITNALFENYKLTNNQKALYCCISATDFVLNDINRTYEGKYYCFSYSPKDKQIIFNASMKGTRLLSQVYSVTKNENLKEEAKKTIAFVIKYQHGDGSWYYSRSYARNWVDNYHTGYILDCFYEYIKLTGDTQFEGNLKKGFDYYQNNFFENNEIPKFYDKRKYPVDCTGAAQSILTLCRFKRKDLAKNVATWMIHNMQSPEGYFYFRKFKKYTIKTSFMRWSNAWMFLALSYLLYKLEIKE